MYKGPFDDRKLNEIEEEIKVIDSFITPQVKDPGKSFKNLPSPKEMFIKDENFSLIEIKELHPYDTFTLEQEVEEIPLKYEIIPDLEELKKIDENKINELKGRLLLYNSEEKNLSNNFEIGHCILSKVEEDFCVDIEYYRKVLNDGDSFYRAFIFSYIEKIIANKNTYELRKIIHGLSKNKIRNPFCLKDKEISKETAMVILVMILTQILNNNTTEAIRILNRAFNMVETFSNIMVKYTKIKIGEFLLKNKNKFDKFELVNNNLILQEYYKEDTFLVDDYIEQKVEIFEMAPDKLIYFIMPYVFPIVNLKINAREKEKKYVLYIEHYELLDQLKEKGDLTIDLIYKEEKHFYLGYNEVYLNQYSHVLNYDFHSIEEFSNKNYTIFCQNIFCNYCQQESSEIYFNKDRDKNLCQNCFISQIKEVLSERVATFIKENYSDLEFYLRPIRIPHLIYFELTDKDILDLTGKNSIYELFYFILTSACLKCGNSNFEHKERIELNCGCKMCKNCVGELLTQKTNGLIYQNSCEIDKDEDGVLLCLCRKPFDFEGARLKVYTEKELSSYQKECDKRLTQYYNFQCFHCKRYSKRKRKNEEDCNFYEFKIECKEKDKEVMKNHLLCVYCAKKKKTEIKKKDLYSKDKKVVMYCEICCEEHSINTCVIKKMTGNCVKLCNSNCDII